MFHIRLIAEIGKLQFIMKQHEGGNCLCNYHIDTVFFCSFEHCTKWRLKTFRSFYISRYMKSEERGIICRWTALVDVNVYICMYVYLLDDDTNSTIQSAIYCK